MTYHYLRLLETFLDLKKYLAVKGLQFIAVRFPNYKSLELQKFMFDHFLFTNKGTMPYIKLRSGKFQLAFSYISFIIYLYNIYLLPFVSLHANSGQLISVEVVSFFIFQ